MSAIIYDPINLSALMGMFEEFELMKLRQSDMEVQLQLVQNDNESLKLKLDQTERKVNILEQKLLQHNIMSNDHEAQTSQERRLTLQFKNGPSKLIYTGKEIKADDGGLLRLELVDASTGLVVDSGPIAKSEVDIVALEEDEDNDDNWTSEDFNRKIVGERKGTKLGGNDVTLKLNKGIGVIGDIKFVSSATHMPQGVFKLGARTIRTFDGIRVREGKTDSFTVEDFRNECYKKYETPALNDKVYRLKNISHKGKILKRLQQRQITSVKDFLVQLIKDPEELKEMVRLQKQKWEETLQNAQNSLPKRLCYYIDPDTNMTVIFNFSDQVLGVVSNSHHSDMEKLPHNDKENARNLAIRALNDWDNVLFADDVDSILDSMDLSISMEQEKSAELKLEDLDTICSSGDAHIAGSNILPSDYEFRPLDVVSQEQTLAPYYDHISTTSTSVDSTFFEGLEYPQCLEIELGKSGGTGVYHPSCMNLSNKHDMAMQNVPPHPECNIEYILRGLESSSSASSSNLLVPPLRPQDEAIAIFNHWNNIQLETCMADALPPFIMENLNTNSSSSTNMALVRNIPWKSWLVVAYILSVRWGLLRNDTITLAKIEDWLTRWRMIQVNVVHSLDDLSVLNVAFKFKKQRTK